MAALINTIGNAVRAVQKVQSDARTTTESYNSLRSTLSGLTGGLVKIPSASTAFSKLANNNKFMKTVLKALGLGDYIGDIDHVLISSAEAEKGAFKWVEKMTTPDDFASPEHTIIFAGDPIYANNTTGMEFVPIGMCQGFQFSSSINATAVKELRCEENYVIPGKSMVGTLTLSRFVGNYGSLTKRLHVTKGYGYNAQSADIKPLFGIMLMFLSPSRKKVLTTLYFERCAITSIGVSINAGEYNIAESISIMYGKCITVGEATIASEIIDSTTTKDVITGMLENDWSYLGL